MDSTPHIEAARLLTEWHVIEDYQWAAAEGDPRRPPTSAARYVEVES